MVLLNISVFSQPSIQVVEGAFLYRFTHFIDWNLKGNTLNLCVYKSPSIYKSLIGSTKGKTIQGSPINIINPSRRNIENCHMIFLGKKLEEKDIPYKALLQKKRVFVVSRSKKDDKLSMIRLKIKNNKLSFDINKTLMNKMEINISSKVLRLADKVY